MLGINLNHVSKRGPGHYRQGTFLPNVEVKWNSMEKSICLTFKFLSSHQYEIVHSIDYWCSNLLDSKKKISIKF